MTLEEEKQLVKDSQNDPESFGLIFDHYYPKILNFFFRRTSNIQISEDLTSEVFFKALRGLQKFKWQSVPFSAWLFRIANNELIDYYRKGLQKTASLNELQDEHDFDVSGNDDASTETIMLEAQKENFSQFQIVKECLGKLPEHYREVLSLKYFEKLSTLEIAHILNKPEGTIKSLVSRGTDLLRDQYNNYQPQPLSTSPVVINESRK
jgi:RNA polymerase sigma-70 factor (ECF subfamily)